MSQNSIFGAIFDSVEVKKSSKLSKKAAVNTLENAAENSKSRVDIAKIQALAKQLKVNVVKFNNGKFYGRDNQVVEVYQHYSNYSLLMDADGNLVVVEVGADGNSTKVSHVYAYDRVSKQEIALFAQQNSLLYLHQSGQLSNSNISTSKDTENSAGVISVSFLDFMFSTLIFSLPAVESANSEDFDCERDDAVKSETCTPLSEAGICTPYDAALDYDYKATTGSVLTTKEMEELSSMVHQQ